MAFKDTLNIVVLAAVERLKRGLRRWRNRPIGQLFSKNRPPERLVLAPPSLLTADPITAVDIYSGRFALAGRLINTHGKDPFRLSGPSLPWQRELHSFEWLRHLEAEGSELASRNARALISDWLRSFGKPRRHLAWEVEIAARRLIAWLCHSVPIVKTGDAIFHRIWMRSVGYHIRFLRNMAQNAPDGMPRLIGQIALVYASICVSGLASLQQRLADNLDAELQRQILDDGGHISRNPAAIPEILALLIALKQVIARQGRSPSQQLVSAIDRLMAALKFYRLGDGALCRFNGVSITANDLIATILCYDDSLGLAPENAYASGYQRLQMGQTVILADTGKPASNALSTKAHAGTLSFEMCFGDQLIFVNCGRPLIDDAARINAARMTAAHSTASINDHSSSQFYTGKRLSRLIGGWLIMGPTQVTCRRKDAGKDADGAKQFEASHNGYYKKFGIIHHRSIRLTDQGDTIMGIDRFSGQANAAIGGKKPLAAAIRFHLHPGVSAGKSEDGRSIILMCGNKIVWKLSCIDVPISLEESIYFATASGPRRSRQIVLEANLRQNSEIRWIIERQLSNS